MASTMLYALYIDSFADKESSNALWAVELMPGYGERIQAQSLHIHWYLARGLDAIGMKIDHFLSAEIEIISEMIH